MCKRSVSRQKGRACERGRRQSRPVTSLLWGSRPRPSTCKQSDKTTTQAKRHAKMAQTDDSSLTILTLAEPLLAAHDSADSLTRASLDAELEHYKDLFSKLRFSYVEQVTKENFLKAIVADPPQLVDAAENALLEEHLAQAKAALKANKERSNQKVQELQELASRLAQCTSLHLDLFHSTTNIHRSP
jgi:hypothetical protein